jgi:hypothetical protein
MLISSFCSIYRLNYYCDMRDALKNLFSNQIILEDYSQFYYTITPYELTNALGSIIAILQEYNFTKKGDNNGQFSCKLYRTKEGNWYDIEEVKIVTEKSILRMLKSAIDAKENSTVLK